MYHLTSLLVALCVCVTPTLQQGPPGIPPVHEQNVVYPDGHGPPEANAHQRGFAGTHDAEHIKEHLKDVVEKPKEEMTEEELEFHYFKLHDYDNNNKLDGTEITKAITHFHGESKDKVFKHSTMPQSGLGTVTEEEEEDEEEGEKAETEHKHAPKVFSDEEILNIVDMVLKEDDLNGDGYIEYVEFVTAQRKARHGDDNTAK